MKPTAMDKLFWTVFGVGGAGLLYLLLAVVNSGYSWADVGGIAEYSGGRLRWKYGEKRV